MKRVQSKVVGGWSAMGKLFEIDPLICGIDAEGIPALVAGDALADASGALGDQIAEGHACGPEHLQTLQPQWPLTTRMT